MDFTVDDLISQATILASGASQKLLEKTREIRGIKTYYDTNAQDIEKDLESSYERDKLIALQRLLALLSRGEDVSGYFPSVVKNIAFPSYAVKRLIYIYLLRYAESEPDLTLLSINSFQKDLNDSNPMIRTVALRVLCSIKVPIIMPIIAMSFKKCAADLSPYVRKAVAVSLPKAYQMDPEQLPMLIEVLEILLADQTTVVLGPAVTAWIAICPDRLELLHKHYRKLCSMLAGAGEWEQIPIIDVLVRYCRSNFKNPEGIARSLWDADFSLFVAACKYPLCSMNPLVVVMVTNFLYPLGDEELKKSACLALIRCLKRPDCEKIMILQIIRDYILSDSSYWMEHLNYFYVQPTDSSNIIRIKLEIIELLACESNSWLILSEFQFYAKSINEDLAIETVKVWKRFAVRIPSKIEATLIFLVSLLSSSSGNLVGEVIVTIRRLLQLAPANQSKISHENLTAYLVNIYKDVTNPLAKTSILWLIGHHSKFKYACDALRIALKSFKSEPVIVKRQILTVSAILFLTNNLEGALPEIRKFCQLAFEYLLKLAKYDMNYDVRDHGRILEPLCLSATLNQHLLNRLLDILIQNYAIKEETRAEASKFIPGTLSHYLNRKLGGYLEWNDWADETKGIDERNVKASEIWHPDKVILAEIKPITRSVRGKKNIVNLDDFYADVGNSAQSLAQSTNSENMESDSLSEYSNSS